MKLFPALALVAAAATVSAPALADEALAKSKNCLACHGGMVSELVHGSTTDEDAVLCVHCHRGVGHGARN